MTEEEKVVLNEVYQANSLAIFAVLNKYSQLNGKEGKDLLDWKRQECAELLHVLEKIKRELAWRAGEKLEPVAHPGEVVLQMVGGI